MKPYAKYVFIKDPETKTTYVLHEHLGADIQGLLQYWQKTKKKGLAGIGFRDPAEEQLKAKFDKTLGGIARNKDGKTPAYTSVKASPDFAGLYAGNYVKHGLNDGLLIRFEDNNEKMILLFYKGLGDSANSLFQRWTAGELSETVETNALPIEGDGEKKADCAGNTNGSNQEKVS